MACRKAANFVREHFSFPSIHPWNRNRAADVPMRLTTSFALNAGATEGFLH